MLFAPGEFEQSYTYKFPLVCTRPTGFEYSLYSILPYCAGENEAANIVLGEIRAEPVFPESYKRWNE